MLQWLLLNILLLLLLLPLEVEDVVHVGYLLLLFLEHH